MKTTRPPDTYESVALGALAYEFKRKKLGPYDQARIDVLRAFESFMPFAVFCYYLK